MQIRDKRLTKMGVGRLCKLFGKTRQAYYGREWHFDERRKEAIIVLELVVQVRRELPGIGGHKLHFMLREPLRTHGIKMGRDRLYKLLRENDLLICRRKKGTKTTYSRHWLKKYPNLIKDLSITQPEQVWVADITYICVGFDFNYLSLITDAYSKKIMGYCLYPSLNNEGPLLALNMALQSRSHLDRKLIHHSDRGVQYCSYDYVLQLKEHEISISMTEQADAYENAIAERVNGILKNEFRLNRLFKNSEEARIAVEASILAYNEKRPHMSCDFMTPLSAHLQVEPLKKRWKVREAKKLPKREVEFLEV